MYAEATMVSSTASRGRVLMSQGSHGVRMPCMDYGIIPHMGRAGQALAVLGVHELQHRQGSGWQDCN